MSTLRPFQTDGGLHFSPSLLDKTGQQWFVHQPFFDTIIQAVAQFRPTGGVESAHCNTISRT